MIADIYFKNATVVTENNMFHGGVAVSGGKIAQLTTTNVGMEAHTVIDLAGKVLMPGLVDGHVHLNEPGRAEWEGYQTGTMAAAAGGVTTVIDMPLNATPPTISLAELERKRAIVATQAVVDYAHWGGLVNNNLADLSPLHDAGAVGFKAFMSESGVDFARIDDDILYAGLKQVAELDTFIAVHPENDAVTSYLAAQFLAQGKIDPRAWCESRPIVTEVEAIQRAALWAEETGGALHIVHASSGPAIQAVADARRRGVSITVETCPHYLFFNIDDFETLGPVAKCAPPLRSQEDVELLWSYLLTDGYIDMIASDHSPCTSDLKTRGAESIWEAWGGISSIQSILPAMLTAGVHQRNWPLTSLVAAMCSNPARRFGLYPQKGALLPGSDADLIVVDLDQTWELIVDQLFYKNKHSPYIGYEFHGQVQATYVRGTQVYQQHEIRVEPGFGQLLLRESAVSID